MGEAVQAGESAPLTPAQPDPEEEALRRAAEIAEEAHIAALQSALSLPELLTRQPMPVAEPTPTPVVEAELPTRLWPAPLDDGQLTLQQTQWPDLSTGGPEIEAWVRQHRHVTVRTVTWNLAAQQPPPGDDTLVHLFPRNRYHIYIIGTEECERSIAASAINPSKKNWEEYLTAAIGKLYVPLRSHTLQAIHIMAFVHVGIAHHCADITSAAVATGIANTLGNKGGVAISLRIAGTTFVFANAHLAAHQDAVKQRNAEFSKLNRELPLLLARKKKSVIVPNGNSGTLSTTVAASAPPPISFTSSTTSSSLSAGDTNFKSPAAAVDTDVNTTAEPSAVQPLQPSSSSRGLELDNCADRVVFMGDLNYRVRGNRQVVDKLLALDMHDVMLANDQLKWSMQQGFVFNYFTGRPDKSGKIFPYISRPACLTASPHPLFSSRRAAPQLQTHVQARLQFGRVRHGLQAAHPRLGRPHPLRRQGPGMHRLQRRLLPQDVRPPPSLCHVSRPGLL